MSHREIIERSWQAPIALIWELFTTKPGIESWFGPKGFDARVDRIELRQGGAFDFTMMARDAEMIARFEAMGRPSSWSNTAVFTQVEAPCLLVYESEVPMGQGTTTFVHRFELREDGDTVHLRLTLEAGSAEAMGGAAMGWRSSLVRFDERVSEETAT